MKMSSRCLKKNELIVLFFIIFSMIICFSYLNDTFFLLDDMPFHLNRISDLRDNLINGKFLSTISDKTLNGYGYANSFFYPDLFLYFPTLLNLIGFSLLTSYKIFIYLLTVATMLIAYISAKKLFSLKYQDKVNSVKFGIIFSILYTTFPYRLINVFYRGALGEILSTIFLPLVLWGIYEILENKDKSKWQVLAIGMTGVIYSHVLSVLMFSFMILIICLFNYKKAIAKQVFINLCKATFLTLGLTAYFLFPLIEKFISQDYYFQVFNSLGKPSQNAFKLLNSPNQILLLIGNILFFLMLMLVNKKVLSKKEKINRNIAYLMEVSLCLMIAMTNLFPWSIAEKIPFISQIQFTWRLFLFVSLFFILGLSKIIHISFNKKKGYLLSIIIAVIFLSTFGFSPYEKEAIVYKNYNNEVKSIGFGEYLPDTFNIKYIYDKGFSITAINGELISSSIYKEKGDFIGSFEVENNHTDLELPITFYNGYKITLNESEIDYQKSSNGLIQINTGNNLTGTIFVQYEYSYIQYLSLIMTISSCIILIKTKRCKG